MAAQQPTCVASRIRSRQRTAFLYNSHQAFSLDALLASIWCDLRTSVQYGHKMLSTGPAWWPIEKDDERESMKSALSEGFDYIYIYIYICVCVCVCVCTLGVVIGLVLFRLSQKSFKVYFKTIKIQSKQFICHWLWSDWFEVCLFVCLFALVLSHINHFSLFNAKSIFIEMHGLIYKNISISSYSVKSDSSNLNNSV